MTSGADGVRRIEDHALLSDCRSAALVSRGGTVVWMCVPRFDSPAMFASLLGDVENGSWSIAPTAPARVSRRYLDGTLVLETTHHTADGEVVVRDGLVVDERSDPEPHRLVRVVEGRRGSVEVHVELRIRFDYGSIVPWVRRVDGDLHAVAGPDAVVVRSPIRLEPQGFASVATFTVAEGEQVAFDLAWFGSSERPPAACVPGDALDETVAWWRRWNDQLTYDGAYADDVRASMTVLKGLSHRRTGAFVAAPTTSLPEWIGGHRNWDYRYCWLRDATFTLGALLEGGCLQEAEAWRAWLVRAVAGEPAKVQIMYGIAGERRLPETELDWLDGFVGSTPVRTGNEAADQVQLDVFGEVMDAMHIARSHGMDHEADAWSLQRLMLEWLADHWRQPDEGIWEMRGGRLHHTYSKVMSWVAFDRGVRAIDEHGLPGDADAWRSERDAVHAEVCDRAADDRGVFTQSYGSDQLDAATLMIPLVGFLPPDDDRVVATVEAIQRDLTIDGLVQRYSTDTCGDGVGGEEGTFLLCSFWLVDALALMGRRDEATGLYERLLGLRNDVGLLAEEYDPAAGRQLGNFPQAFSHIAIANSAITLCERHLSPAEERARR